MNEMNSKNRSILIDKLRRQERPTALITGGVNGIGRITGEYLANLGWRVIIADIDKAGLESLPCSLIPMYLDVTDSNSLVSGLEVLEKHIDGLDAIINCAGILVVGSVIDVAEDEIMRILNTNFLGTYRVNLFFLPYVLKREGRIIIMSSEIGVQTTFPFNGPYAISKYALEAYSDALRRELIFLGIKVIKIRAGAVRSRMTDGVIELFEKAAIASTHFHDLIVKNLDLVRSESEKGIDPEVVAKTISIALTSKRPKKVYSIKPDLRRTLLSMLPVSISDLLIGWFLHR